MDQTPKKSRTLYNLESSNEKFKIDNLYKSSSDPSNSGLGASAQNFLMNIGDMNEILQSKSLCSMCNSNIL